MANKELTAKVRIDTANAHRSLDKLLSKIKQVDSFVNKNTNSKGLEKGIERAILQEERLKRSKLQTQLYEERVTTQTQKTAQAISKNQLLQEQIVTQQARSANAQNKVTTAAHHTKNAFSGIASKLRTIISLYSLWRAAQAGIKASDTITSATNKLNYVTAQTLGDSAITTDANGNKTYTDRVYQASSEAMDKMYVSAQKVRTSYANMMSNVGKTMTLAGGAFDNNIDNAIRFQEIMAESYTIGGATASEMHNSMTQLTQALGAGILAGDELRSVREGAPLAYHELEKFAQEVYNTSDSLKDMAADGLITSEMVVAGIMRAGKTIDEAFEMTDVTFTQMWEKIKNTALYAWKPISKQLNKMLNDFADGGGFEKIENALLNVGKAFNIMLKVAENTFTWISDNWHWLQHIIVGGLILMASFWAYNAGVAVVSAVQTMIAMGAVAWTIIIIVAAVLALIYVFLAWKNGSISTCTAIFGALMIVALAIAIVAALFGLWPLAIVAAVIALIAIIFMFFEKVCGIVAWFGAWLWNRIVAIVNAIIQFLWTFFVERWIGIIEWVLNVFNGGLDSFGDRVKNLLGNIISWFLSLGKVVTKIIDAIFGTNWTDGLSSLQNKLLSWGKNEKAITLSREAPEVLHRIDATDAYAKGVQWGEDHNGWKDKINTWGSQFQNEKGSSLNNLGKKLGLDLTEFGFPNPNDNQLTPYVSPENDALLESIKGDTDKIANSTELSEEDLKYLRQIAEMEWRKEYTSVNVSVDMKNDAVINNQGDLSNWATSLRDMLSEEMNAAAEGVYA